MVVHRLDTTFVPASVARRESSNELDTCRRQREYVKEAVKDFDNWFTEISTKFEGNETLTKVKVVCMVFKIIAD